MPITTLVWLAIYWAGVLASIANPLFGTLAYLFEYYLRPSLHWWGKILPDLRWNFLVAAVITATFLIRRSSLKQLPAAARAPALCLLALGVVMLVTTTFAVDPNVSWTRTTDYLKLILFFALVIGTVRTEWGFDAFVATHLLGAGWWGWEAFRDPKREAGRLLNIGSGDTLGDNAAAAHLVTVLPFIVVYGLMHKDKRLKGLAIVVAPFVVNAIVLCNSRGSLVAMLAAGGVAFLLTKSGHRLRMVGAGIAFAVMLLMLADPQFLSRQQTITNYQEDGSANERIASVYGGMNLMADYPLGAGGGGFTRLSPIYIPEVVTANRELRDPHNTVILVGSDWGFLGLALYLGFYLTCFSLLRQVRKQSNGGIWYYRSVAIQLAMVSVFVAGLFTDRLYAEAPYWMGALAVVLHRLHADKLATERATGSLQETEDRPETLGWAGRAAMASPGATPGGLR